MILFSRIHLSTYNISEGKSRRDGILLTVDFNLQSGNAANSLQSPAGTTYWRDKVLSLRDFSPLIQHHYKLLISHSYVNF